MKNMSVKLKVTLWYTTVMVIVSAIALFAMSTITKDMVEKDLKARIVRTVTDFSHRLNFRNGRFMLPPGNRLYEQGVHMVVFDENKILTEGQIPFDLQEYSFDFSHDELRLINYNGEKYYEFDRMVISFNRNVYWVKGLMAVSNESMAVNSAIKNNILLSVVLTIVAAFGGYLIIRRAFVPVNRIRKTAEEISKSSDLSRRINLGEGTDEIHALASTFDEMLEKLENTLEREKQFTSDASHELRTPLAVILSECEFIKSCADSKEDYTESIDSIKRQADKMQKLISELLTISRMDKNTQQVNFEETDISELLNFVCDEQEEINTKSVSLIRDIDEKITAKSDKFLLARLFINLISNAYQYSKETGEITVSLKKQKEKVVFIVKDNGIGIAKENISKIWERFYQEEPSRTSNENGSMGLGLSMVKWIAGVHDGKLSVESEIGKGSEFKFVF